MRKTKFLIGLPLCIVAGLVSVAQAQVSAAGTPLFQRYTPSSGEATVGGSTRIIFATAEDEIIDRLKKPRGWLEKLRLATGLNLDIVVGETPDADDILFTKTLDSDFSAMTNNFTLTVHAYNDSLKFDSSDRLTNSIRGTFKVDIDHLISAEGYKYKVGSSGVQFQYKESEGAFRAFQTLVRILMKSNEGTGNHRKLPYGEGVDYPTQKKRIVMLDTGRFFTPTDQVIGFMEKMSLHRINVLQMHLNDDADHTGYFRLEGSPELAPDGLFYTRADWDRIEEAAERYGIEIIPEFNSPGHSSAWIQDNPGMGFFNGWRHNRRAIDVNSANNRQQAVNYLSNLILSYRDWFRGDTVHLGGEESLTNVWANVVTYLNLLRDRLEYHPTNNPNGFKHFQAWSDYNSLANFPGDTDFTHWLSGYGQVINRRKTNSNEWYDLDGGQTYFVPAGGWLQRGYRPDTHAYNAALAANKRNWYNSGNSGYPNGMGIALWNDFTVWALRPRERGNSVVNAGMAPGFAGLGLSAWYGHLLDSNGQVIKYSNLNYEDLIPVSQELSSYWVRRRFPYLSGSQALDLLFATAQHEQVA